MGPLLPLILVLFAGVGLAVQAPTNGMLAKSAGSVVLASLASFGVGAAVLLVAWLTVDRTPVAALKGAPAWAWAGGLYGAFFVAAMAFGAPRLGLAVALTVAVASQLAAALVIDRFGLLGLPAVPLSVSRIAGVALVLAGAVLVRRG